MELLTLFVLTRTRAQARELARIIQDEDWGGEVQVYEDQEQIDRALGTGWQEYGLLSVWWEYLFSASKRLYRYTAQVEWMKFLEN